MYLVTNCSSNSMLKKNCFHRHWGRSVREFLVFNFTTLVRVFELSNTCLLVNISEILHVGETEE